MKTFYRCLTVLFACTTILLSNLLLPHSARAAEPADPPSSTIVQWQASAESAQEFLATAKKLNLTIEEGDADTVAKLMDSPSVEVLAADKITADELTELLAQRRASLSNIGSNLTLHLSDAQISGRDLADWVATSGIIHQSSGTCCPHNRIIIIIVTDCCVWIIIFG